MQQGESKGIRRPSPAMVVAVIALIVALSGSAYAALGKNSVGPRQLKAQAVTTGKIANNAINGAKVANGSLTGADVNDSQLGIVPAASDAAHAGNADTVSGHAAACPGGTTLIRGICFDSSSHGPVSSVTAAADGCAARGGYLPTPMELYSARNVLNLGSGIGDEHQFTDSYYDNTNGTAYSTIEIDGTGALTRVAVEGVSAHYTCAYPLVR